MVCYLLYSPCLWQPVRWVSAWGTSSVSLWSSSVRTTPYWSSSLLHKHTGACHDSAQTLYVVMIYLTNLCFLYFCFSLSLWGLSLCRVSQIQETQACLLQWLHQTPKPITHMHRHYNVILNCLFHIFAVCGVCISLTCVLMVSESALNQSLITLSISDWISSSVPTRVFSCRGQSSHQVSGIILGKGRCQDRLSYSKKYYS